MNSKRGMFTREYLWRSIVTMCGLFVIVITLGIGGFLYTRALERFLKVPSFNRRISFFHQTGHRLIIWKVEEA